MGFGRGNLARREHLQSVSARQLSAFAIVEVCPRAHWLKSPSRSNVQVAASWTRDVRWALKMPTALYRSSRTRSATARIPGCPMFEECEFCIPLKRQTSAFGLVRGRWEKSSALQVAAGILDLKISDKTLVIFSS